MKKLKWILFAFIILALVSVTTWAGYNLWPRPMEPALWTEADLPPLPDPKQNGWEILRLSGVFETKWDLPKELVEILNLSAPHPPASSSNKNWLDLSHQRRSEIESLTQQYSKPLDVYLTSLDSPAFAKTESLISAFEERQEPSLNFIDYLNFRKVFRLYLIQLVLQKRWGEFDVLWRKTLQQDLNFAQVSRGLLEQVAALYLLTDHTYFLSQVQKNQTLPLKEDLKKSLREIPWDNFHFKRALIAEYLFPSKAVESLMSDVSKAGFTLDALFTRVTVNPAWLRRELNARFRKYIEFEKKPVTITEKETNPENSIEIDYEKKPFWWFEQSGSKMVLMQTQINILLMMQDFYNKKSEMQKYTQDILDQDRK